MNDTATKNYDAYLEQGDINPLHVFVKSIIRNNVNVAIPVRVDSIIRPADSGGASYLSATPLIQQRSADGDALPAVSIPKLRWFRAQHGTAAIICDPKPGDVGLAVFAHQDVSTLTGGNTPVVAGSYRNFDMSDGFYFGGFWGKKPTTFIRIEDSGNVDVTAPVKVTVNTTDAVVNTKTCTVNASNSITFNSPKSRFTGDVIIDKTLSVSGLISGAGGLSVSGGSGASVTGDLKTTGDVVAGGISLEHHTHNGGSTPDA